MIAIRINEVALKELFWSAVAFFILSVQFS
jgi:hypothetical protein